MVSFLKKKAVQAASAKPPFDPDEDHGPSESNPTQKAKPSSTGSALKKANLPSWLHKGKAAHKKLDEAEAKAEARKAEMDLMRDFYLKEGEENRVTFLDGDLDDDGMIDCYVYEQHKLKVGNEWRQYVCTNDAEGWCPLCNLGDNFAQLVGVLTVMVHTPYTIKSGQNAGKVLTNRRMLFKATQKTLKTLSKQAVKRGGLRGATFDISRTDDKTPRVGDQFEFIEKLTMKQLAEKYGVPLEECVPATVADEVVYRSPEELLELGLGKAASGPGYTSKKKDMSDDM